MKSSQKNLLRYPTLLFLTLILATLAGCPSGNISDYSNAATSNIFTDGKNLVATAVKSDAPVSTCPDGGITLESGIDTNGNKTLEPSEVMSTQYVCNDTANRDMTKLARVEEEPAGAHCAGGGNVVRAGLDTNNNKILDGDETKSTSYICVDASRHIGHLGHDLLVGVVVVPAGPICTYAGNQINIGPDLNSDGILQPEEITSSAYACNGAPGSGIVWNTVTSPTNANPNNGYIANNNSQQVSITLPASAALVAGDLVQVTGAGAGGWKIAQNSGQSVITRDMYGSIGRSWTARMTDALRDWRGIASSADGNKLIASVANGYLYTSTDSGVSWTPRLTDAAREWRGVSSSSDGNTLIALAHGGNYWISTDSGVHWTEHVDTANWSSVASSADGSKLVAAANLGYLYSSSEINSTDLVERVFDTTRDWRGVATSADGSKMVAVAYGGNIYTSSDSGHNWTTRESTRNWVAVASSADGSKLVAAVSGGQLYTSTDSGVTWTPRESTRTWVGVASSADGSKLVAAAYSGQIYTSSDSGITWTPRDTARHWQGVASSADGSKLVATADGGLPSPGDYLYTSIPIAVDSTTPGTGGSILGAQYDAVDLQYIGNSTFLVRGFKGLLEVR